MTNSKPAPQAFHILQITIPGENAENNERPIHDEADVDEPNNQLLSVVENFQVCDCFLLIDRLGICKCSLALQIRQKLMSLPNVRENIYQTLLDCD